MRRWGRAVAAVALLVTGIGAARAESGGFFKNLFSGVGTSRGGDVPSLSGPKLQDPNEAYCPQIDVRDGGAAMQAFAGAAGDNSRLRHQLTFGRMSRECTVRDGGAVGVRVGVEIRALLGPAGASGTFEAPLTVSLKYNDKVVATQTRRVAVQVPAGAAQGQASVVADELRVPADMAVGYDIEVALAGAPAHAKAPARSAARRTRPTAPQTTAAPAEAPAAVQ